MSRIIFQESYIVVLPSFSKTATHKHPFMHLFVGANGCKIKVEKRELQSNIIMLDSNVEHVVEDRADCDFFLLIDPTSAIAEKIIDKYLCDSRYYDIDANIADIPKDINALSDKEIAKAVFLSESRLTHLFKENTGISLKSYILIRRLEQAYRFVNSGGKVTRVAMESGFASSAHLAYTCKTLTGISITEVLRSTE